MNHEARLLEMLSAKNIFMNTLSVTGDAIAAARTTPDMEFIPGLLTCKQFADLDGWWASTKILNYLTSVWVARMSRMYYARVRGAKFMNVAKVLVDAEPAENEAVQMLLHYFARQKPAVSPERVKELEDMADAWFAQDAVQLDKVLAAGKWVDRQTQ